MDKQTSTNVQTVGLAGAVAFVGVWLLGYFAPDLMAEAPPGVESAFTTILAIVFGAFLPSDFLQGKQ